MNIYIYIDNSFVCFLLIYYIDYNIKNKVNEYVNLKPPKINLFTYLIFFFKIKGKN